MGLLTGYSDRDGRLDVWERVVVLQFEVFEGEVIDVGDGGVDYHRGQRSGCAAELEFGLFEVVRVEVEVSKGMDEVAGLVATHLGHHFGEEGVARDVEGNAQKQVRTALIELARETGFLGLGIVDVELKEEVAGGEGHFIDFPHVPG